MLLTMVDHMLPTIYFCLTSKLFLFNKYTILMQPTNCFYLTNKILIQLIKYFYCYKLLSLWNIIVTFLQMPSISNEKLVFQSKYLVFRSKTLDFDRNTRYFKSKMFTP